MREPSNIIFNGNEDRGSSRVNKNTHTKTIDVGYCIEHFNSTILAYLSQHGSKN